MEITKKQIAEWIGGGYREAYYHDEDESSVGIVIIERRYEQIDKKDIADHFGCDVKNLVITGGE